MGAGANMQLAAEATQVCFCFYMLWYYFLAGKFCVSSGFPGRHTSAGWLLSVSSRRTTPSRDFSTTTACCCRYRREPSITPCSITVTAGGKSGTYPAVCHRGSVDQTLGHYRPAADRCGYRPPAVAAAKKTGKRAAADTDKKQAAEKRYGGQTAVNNTQAAEKRRGEQTAAGGSRGFGILLVVRAEHLAGCISTISSTSGLTLCRRRNICRLKATACGSGLTRSAPCFIRKCFIMISALTCGRR